MNSGSQSYHRQSESYDRIVNWSFGDFIFNSAFDNISSTIKARRHGFDDCTDTEYICSASFSLIYGDGISFRRSTDDSVDNSEMTDRRLKGAERSYGSGAFTKVFKRVTQTTPIEYIEDDNYLDNGAGRRQMQWRIGAT
jgi:hypothetical protein